MHWKINLGTQVEGQMDKVEACFRFQQFPQPGALVPALL